MQETQTYESSHHNYDLNSRHLLRKWRTLEDLFATHYTSTHAYV